MKSLVIGHINVIIESLELFLIQIVHHLNSLMLLLCLYLPSMIRIWNENQNVSKILFVGNK